MASIDLKNDIKDLVALDTQVIASDVTTAGNIIDTVGFESVTFVLQAGVVTAGDVEALIEDGDDSGLSDAAAVADDFLIGTEASTNISATNGIATIGYVGKKRYVRLSSVTANSANLTVGSVVILGTPRHAAVA